MAKVVRELSELQREKTAELLLNVAQGLLLGMAIAIVLPTFQNQVNLSLTIVGGLMIMILYMWAMKLIQGLERK